MAIANYRIDYKAVRKRVESQALPSLKDFAINLVERRVRNAQQKMLEAFDRHPVTLEIGQGKSGSNISGTLGGYGNLFTFIGFEDGSRPTSGLRNLLAKEIPIIFRGFLKRGSEFGDLKYEIRLPSILALELESPIPWAIGDSWATGIEKGISGVGQYLSLYATASRSGGGIQNVKINLPRRFSPQPYLSSILDAFVRNF